MGDMNIDLSNHKNKTHVPSNARKLLNILDSCNLTQIISSFTRISSASKTIIDHAYVNNNKEIIHTVVPKYGISDHYPICIIRKYSKNKERTDGRLLFYRNLNNFDTNCFMEDMCNCSWADLKNGITPDKSLAVWSDLYNNVLHKHMLIIQKRVKRSQQPKWMNKDIKFAIHTRDYMKKNTKFYTI